MIKNLKYRFVDRPCYCRICNKDFDRNEEKLITFWSAARKGGTDILCKNCVKIISEMVKEDEI